MGAGRGTGLTHGADPDQLDALAHDVSGAADRLSATHAALRARLHTAPWTGPDAQSFRQDWDTTHHRVIGEACTRLRDAATALRRNADEQRQASAAPGAGVAGVVAGLWRNRWRNRWARHVGASRGPTHSWRSGRRAG